MRAEALRGKQTPPDVVERPSDGVARTWIRSCAGNGTGAGPLMHDQLNDSGQAASRTIPGGRQRPGALKEAPPPSATAADVRRPTSPSA